MSRVDTDAMRQYEQTRDDLVARLLVLEPLLVERDLSEVRSARKRLQGDTFVLAVVGEFSSGKSFLLNALLGKFRYEQTSSGTQLAGLLATDINPSTATITELNYGRETLATAVYEDGRTERIPLDRLNRFIAVGNGDVGTIHDATNGEADAPSRVVVATDSPFLERGFVLADTPGLASINPAHRRATLQFLPTADAVLYLIDSQQPFTEGDAAFLGIVRQHIDSIFIVQTKIDLWQQPQSDGRPAWEHAYERIANMAAIHAPGTYVYALSAREYVDGVLTGDPGAVEASRFPTFLAALDASLIRRTGRARLRRVASQIDGAVTDTLEDIGRDLDMLALDATSLSEQRAMLVPALRNVDERARTERERILRGGMQERKRIDERGLDLAQELERALSQGFDSADIARLRDRARLHIIVDRVLAAVVADFARDAAQAVCDDIESSLERIETIAPVRWSVNDAAARAFGAESTTSLWSGDVRAAVAATIVLEAIGGPAIALVHDIASRFATRQPGSYMKRELLADLRSEIFPRLRTQTQAFADRIGSRMQRVYDDLAQALARAVVDKRDIELGSIDRALQAGREGTQEAVRAALLARRSELAEGRAHVAATVEHFIERDEEIAPADAGSEAVRIAHADAAAFDAQVYDAGLQPTRWRVAVLGALRRGKSSLINAIAGRVVLTDDVAGSVRFPIHVRYGPSEQAFTLDARGRWEELPFERASAAAADAPVLVLVPWSLPRELVLVHAPAFDSGDSAAEDITVVAASHASEVLCLFSRQLSDRELAVYERVAEFGKPMTFAHTIADNEAPSERRGVVELASQYLRERNIASERIFVVSSLEYQRAVAAGRAPAGWNQLEALRSTLEAHAQAHMARLERLARSASEHAALAAPVPEPPPRKAGFFARFLGKGR
mgnify:CR=1 FL=1